MSNKVQTFTLKVSENTKEKMTKYFADKKRLKTPPYAIFQADEADTVVTLYESGKAVFQGISADIDANMWSQMEKNLNPTKKTNLKKAGEKEKKKDNNKEKSNLYYINSIGSDEVGTGDFFGPVVVTASYVTKEDIPFLEKLGVKDSKKLTDESIKKIVPQIIKKIPYSSIIITNEKYNQKYSTNMNLNTMKAILHNKVLLNLSSKYSGYDKIVIDQFTPERTYYKYLNKVPNVQKNITFVTKGEDKCLSVACSSLISRYIFIKEFDKLSKELNITLPKGAGDIVDEVGASIVKKYGIDTLNKYAKLNFKNLEKIKELANN